MRPSLPLRRLQLVLAAVAVAAAVVMFGLFSTEARLGCLAAVVVGASLTAEERHRRGGGWWTLIAAGVALSLAGLAITGAAETLGGVLAIAGSALAIVGATIGFPLGGIEFEHELKEEEGVE